MLKHILIYMHYSSVIHLHVYIYIHYSSVLGPSMWHVRDALLYIYIYTHTHVYIYIYIRICIYIYIHYSCVLGPSMWHVRDALLEVLHNTAERGDLLAKETALTLLADPSPILRRKAAFVLGKVPFSCSFSFSLALANTHVPP